LSDDLQKEGLARKRRSETILQRENVRINAHLPRIETSTEALRRGIDEIAHRALALKVVAVKADGLKQATLERLVADYGLAPHFTPNERAFIADPAPQEQACKEFVWRHEAAWVLYWALGYAEALGRPDTHCDLDAAAGIMLKGRTKEFIANARLRPFEEILDEADLIFRYHWAVVQARLDGQEPPAGLIPGLVYERHYALNWLVGYPGRDNPAEWDDISTDT